MAEESGRPPGPAGANGKSKVCCYATGLNTTWYTSSQQWQALGGPMSATLSLDQGSEVAINYTAVGTTTTAVCDRAGVSRGAQLHHFPTKKELVTTAVEHILDKRMEDFRRAFSAAILKVPC